MSESEQTENIYSMDSKLEGINGYEGKTPRELIEKSISKDIFKLIKRGYRFDDEVRVGLIGDRNRDGDPTDRIGPEVRDCAIDHLGVRQCDLGAIRCL